MNLKNHRNLSRILAHTIAMILMAMVAGVSPAAGAYPFVDNLDILDEWNADSPWGLSTTVFHSSPSSATDSPGTAYQNNLDISLTMVNGVDLSAGSAPYLSFRQKRQLEAGFDFGRVEISVDGGTNWTLLQSYTGVVSSWKQEQIDLADYSTATSALIRFRLVTDKSIGADGWYIDDVVIADPPNPVLDLAANLSDSSATSIDLSWSENADPGFASYVIYRSKSEGVSTDDTLVATIADRTTITYTDSGLDQDTTYYYKVYVYDTNGIGAAGKEASAATGLTSFTYPWTTDLEGSVSGWTAEDPWGITSLTGPESHTGSPSKVWTDSPFGSYAGGVNTALMFTIDLGAANQPVFSFWQKYALEEDSDYGYVEVRKIGTSTWDRIYFLTGTSAAWFQEFINLSNYAGTQVDIRFRLQADTNGVQSQGWLIDDLKIDETEAAALPFPFSDDMESGGVPGNWFSSSWSKTSDAHSGNNAYTDSIAGNYGIETWSELSMANSMDLSGTVNPQLAFWHKYNFYSNNSYYCSGYTSEYDYGRVYISTYNGQPGTWIQLGTFNGSQSSWTRSVFDLSAWAGLPNVRLKFVVDDNQSANNRGCNHRADGWTIDDIVVEELPLAVSLTKTASSMDSVSMSWTENSDTDFDHYEIYRASSTGVTRSSTLIATINDQATQSYTDAMAIIQPSTYYYRIWVVDTDGNASVPSNEIIATYSVPLNTFPFADDAESGTDKWSYGSPWGMTSLQFHDGGSSWTDSPGANYGANANTSLSTFIDLSGTQHPVLSFYHRYALEEKKDFVYLEVSVDEGTNWTALRFFTGTENLWNLERIDLSAYAGNAKLGLRFRLTSDGANQLDGWYMDQLSVAEEAVGISTYPVADDMESGAIPWFYTSTWGQVTLSDSDSHTGSPSTVWTDSPEGAYAAGIDTWLMLSVDLSIANIPILTFWNKYSFESNSDWGYVEVRESGGNSWSRLFLITGTLDWKQARIDLAGYAGKAIDIRFRVVTDTNGVQSDGWYIDDLQIDETTGTVQSYPYFEDFESGDTDWVPASWSLTTDAHTGNSAFTDSIEGNYAPDSWNELIMSKTIDLTTAQQPQLAFWHKYAFYSTNSVYCSGYTNEYDYGRVYLSTFYGQPGTWTQIASFSGTQSDWGRSVIDLSAWAGLTDIRIKFVMDDNLAGNNNCNHSADGWTIDDIAIEELPRTVQMSLVSATMHDVSLAWTVNNDSDFDRYELYRSSSVNVTRSNILVNTFSNQDVLDYTDAVAINQPGTLYYRMWVVDTDGNISPASNEIMVTYEVPRNSNFPFTENGESGQDQWAWGSPWGLTDEAAYDGTFSWTDSPGANYPANADTALTTFVNLSGTSTPVLTFWHRYSLEDNTDYVRLEVSVDSGVTWTQLRAYTGTETDWNRERIDFSAYAGNANLGLRFRLTSDGTNQQDGWFMDGLTIQNESTAAGFPFFDDMEHGISPWFYDSPWSIVDLTPEQSHTGAASTVWSDSPAGSYGSGTASSLYLTIDLGTAVMPVLSFWQKYSFEANSDWGYIEMREQGTSSWGRYYAITGTSPAWVQDKMDLSFYAGKKIELRFVVSSDTNGTQSDGWMIDDISITETSSGKLAYPFVDDMESPNTANNWLSSSWELVSDANSGTKAFTDSPAGNYAAGSNSRLTMASSIDLSRAVHPQLSFWHKFHTYNTNSVYCSGYTNEYDYGRVYISTFNGQSGTFSLLASYSGNDTNWAQATLDLSAYAGLPDVRIIFVMNNNRSGNNNCDHTQDGWTIDDVRIGEDLDIPTYIMIKSGNNQIGETGLALAEPFTAVVYDSGSNPVAGIPVVVEVDSGEGTLSEVPTVSGTGGEVSTTLYLGDNPGENRVTITINGSAESVQFGATGYAPGTPVALSLYSGNNQAGPVNTQIENALAVKVTDIRGSLVEGTDITFSILSGGGTLTVTNATTDAGGIAETYLDLGANAGKVQIAASASGLIGSPAGFTEYGLLTGGNIGDVDGDGMPDEWEDSHGFNDADPADAQQDQDGDTLTNVEEYLLNTNPSLADTDGDGMPDGWERLYGLDPNDYFDGWADNDGDGIINRDEYADGTPPVPARHFQPAWETSEWMDIYGTVQVRMLPAVQGDEVGVYDPDGVLCGAFTVDTPGEYGFMHVFADDASTPTVDEGAEPGDELSFMLWDADKAVEVNAATTVVSGTDPPTYTFTGDQAEVNLTGAQTQQIPLQAGWNLISFAVKTCYYADGINGYADGQPAAAMLSGIKYQKVDDIADAFASIAGKFELIRGFDADGAHTYDPALTDFNDMKYIAAGYGYWIKMTESATLSFYGIRAKAEDTLAIGQGWNLTGYWHPYVRYTGVQPLVDFPPDVYGFQQVNGIDTVLQAIDGQYQVMRGFDADGAHTYDPLLGAFNDLDYMGPGYGYWIRMLNAGTLAY